MPTTSSPTTLLEWLSLLEQRHSKEIDMGLDRVNQVKQALNIQFSCPVIMVAGTNGKGSTCSMLESVLMQAGYRVGLYIKPHFLDFNERARVLGVPAADEVLISAFEQVERARGDISLTYFEFTTLAICLLLSQAPLDVVILEVGLGGRLDAVNVIDADVSIVTNIDIDHTEYLGDTREKIGFEKAGIYRSGKVAICSDPHPPQSLIDHAQKIGADLRLFGRDFNYNGDKQQWNFAGRQQRRNSLAYPSLRGANQLLNACAVLSALEALHLQLPVGAQDVRSGLVMVELPGRFQVLPGRPTIVLDVAHNPHAAATLAQNCNQMSFHPYTYAVFGSMLDKDIGQVVSHLKSVVDHWCVCDLPLPRAASSAHLAQQIQLIDTDLAQLNSISKEKSINQFASPEEAFMYALSKAGENDRILVFGSFLTVAGVMRARKKLSSNS
jgi:dihydrofolate synthase/folylpolyglutamate synthase